MAALQGLKSLDLDETKVTGSGLKELAALQKLEVLSLEGCKGVKDADVKELAALKGLKKLNLGPSSVTSVGVAVIQRALADCQIQH